MSTELQIQEEEDIERRIRLCYEQVNTRYSQIQILLALAQKLQHQLDSSERAFLDRIAKMNPDIE